MKNVLQVETLESLDVYLKNLDEIGSAPLSREEEESLSLRSKEGDDNARNKLIEGNLRFVIKVAKEYAGRGLEMQDLVSAGNLGLVIAAYRFDGSRGYKFISYAVWYIRQAITHAITRESRPIRLPESALDMIYKIRATISSISNNGKDAPLAEVCEIVGISETTAQGLLSCFAPSKYLDEEPEGSKSLFDKISDSSLKSAEQEIDCQEMVEVVQSAVDSLPEIERLVIIRYFGLRGEKSYTLEEIAYQIGRTRERVRQIKERAFMRLKGGVAKSLRVIKED